MQKWYLVLPSYTNQEQNNCEIFKLQAPNRKAPDQCAAQIMLKWIRNNIHVDQLSHLLPQLENHSRRKDYAIGLD